MVKAAIVHEHGQEAPDVRGDVELIGPGEGEVRVRVHSTGVCHSDISGMSGVIPQPAPFVLGHEGAGEVVEVGPGVTKVAEGDRVIISWIPPCGECRYCLNGEPHLCQLSVVEMSTPRFELDGEAMPGFAGTGTFAEEMVVAEHATIPFADDVPWEIGALIGCGVMTGVGAAINTDAVAPGSSVAVIGCGGVGVSAIQGARIAGAAEIVAIDTVEDKLGWAEDFGASHGVTPDGVDDVVQEVTGGEGFDAVFEAVGAAATMRQAYDLTRRGGTAVIVGAGDAEDMVEFSAFELFYMDKTIKGTIYGGADVRTDFDRLIRLWRAGRLDLEGMITRRLELDQVTDALEAMKRGEVVRQVINFE